MHAAEGSGTEPRSADQSARRAEKIFAFIFQLPGWALVAPSSLGDQSGQSFLLGPPSTLGLVWILHRDRVLQFSNSPFLS